MGIEGIDCELLEAVGISIPEFLLPNPEKVKLAEWFVPPCDVLGQKEWKHIDSIVKNSPSTRHIVYPEAYLTPEIKEHASLQQKIADNVHAAMQSYIDNEILISQGYGFILIDRKTPFAESRKGLLVALDLEKYYRENSDRLIHPTEGAVKDRLPLRKVIRKNAPLEIPHIMVLIDDPEKRVIDPLFDKRAFEKEIYDVGLMMNGGRVKGYLINNPATINTIARNLKNLIKEDFLYLIGDGNHSLEAAKAVWEELKVDLRKKGFSEEYVMRHSARYASAELVNIHDEGLTFHPIHRVVYSLKEDVSDVMRRYCYIKRGIFRKVFWYDCSEEDMKARVNGKSDKHIIGVIGDKGYRFISLDKRNNDELAVRVFQEFLDDLIKNGYAEEICYIHDYGVAKEKGQLKNNIAFYLPAIDKNKFFSIVRENGILPRKAFSVGLETEKSYYGVCRRINI